MQAGEDDLLTEEWIEEIVWWIKRETRLAVTLSLGETFSALLRKYLEAGKSPIRIHAAAVSPLFRFVGDIEWLPWNGDRQAKRLQDIAELISEICRPLHKCIVARNENAAIRRDILIGHPRRYNLGEELLQRSVFVSQIGRA